MNSLVLKPCRWVVFLLVVIPGMTPSPAPFLVPAVLAAGALPRTAPREAWEVRRVSADFFGPRLMPAEPFFDLCRVFPATAHAWNARPLLWKPWNSATEK